MYACTRYLYAVCMILYTQRYATSRGFCLLSAERTRQHFAASGQGDVDYAEVHCHTINVPLTSCVPNNLLYVIIATATSR